MTFAGILAENLAGIDSRLARLYRQLPAHENGFCDLLLSRLEIESGAAGEKPTIDAEELALSYRALSEELIGRPEADGAVREAVDALFSAGDSVLGALRAKELARRLRLAGYPPFDPAAPARTAYFRNAYSDEAFRRFAGEFREPTVTYCDSFAAVCEELYAERCDYALLPVESDRDGRLSGVDRLITRYEFAPVFFTKIETADGNFLRFGLFAPAPLAQEKAEAIEVIAFADENSRLVHLFTAADLLGCTLEGCQPIPSDRDFQKGYRLLFSSKKPEALEALTIFLFCEYPHHLFCGAYRELR